MEVKSKVEEAQRILFISSSGEISNAVRSFPMFGENLKVIEAHDQLHTSFESQFEGVSRA